MLYYYYYERNIRDKYQAQVIIIEHRGNTIAAKIEDTLKKNYVFNFIRLEKRKYLV